MSTGAYHALDLDTARHRQLLLTYDFPPMPGGIARLTGELAIRYPAGSLLISTGSFDKSSAFDAQLPNRVDRLGIRSGRLRTIQGLMLWSHRATQLARAFRPGFVWCGNLKPAGFPALWLNGRVDIPYGIILYGSELLLLQQRIRTSRFKRGTAGRVFRRAEVLVAISEWTRRLCLEVLEGLGYKSGDFDVRRVPLGTDPAHFRPGLGTLSVGARYGLGPGRWLITVARLVGHKGIDTGLRVLAGLRAAYPDLRYAVVGAGPLQTQLEALARELGVGHLVRFLTTVPDEDLPALYNCAEIYLGLSRAEGLLMEGFGISLVEASACGLPVIGARQGGIPDAVREGETGLLVDSTDLHACLEAVRSLLQNQELARRLGLEGRRAVESYYNWDRVTADVRRTGEELAR